MKIFRVPLQADYVNNLIEGYNITDHKGELKYLTVETESESASEETETDGAAQ